MSKELHGLIRTIASALEQYEDALGDVAFPEGRKVSLVDMYYHGLLSYSLTLCSLDGTPTEGRISLITRLLDINITPEDAQHFCRSAIIGEKFSQQIPPCVQALIHIENMLFEALEEVKVPILPPLVLVYDHLTHSLITFGCTSQAELSKTEMQFAGDFLDNIRNYARKHYFSPKLIKDSEVYSSSDGNVSSCKNTVLANLYSSTLSAGDSHAVGIKTDGTAVAVGNDDHNECDVFSWRNLTSISAGPGHTVGIMNNGRCVATGRNCSGECNVGLWENIQSVSAAWEYTVALDCNGHIFAAGRNSEKILSSFSEEPLISISARTDHIVGLRNDGTVVAYGDNTYGQCNVKDWSDIIAISAGYEHTLGLKRDGTVLATGLKKGNRCEVWSWQNIIAISAGAWHSVGLCKDGTVVVAGIPRYDREEISHWRDIVAISAGADYTLGLLSDGTVEACGDDDYGECDASEWGNILLPRLLS